MSAYHGYNARLPIWPGRLRDLLNKIGEHYTAAYLDFRLYDEQPGDGGSLLAVLYLRERERLTRKKLPARVTILQDAQTKAGDILSLGDYGFRLQVTTLGCRAPRPAVYHHSAEIIGTVGRKTGK